MKRKILSLCALVLFVVLVFVGCKSNMGNDTTTTNNGALGDAASDLSSALNDAVTDVSDALSEAATDVESRINDAATDISDALSGMGTNENTSLR